MKKISRVYFIAILAAWITAAGSGFLLLAAHQARPGRPGTPPARWPEESPIPLDPARPTLLIFLHPRCPCSRASVDELTEIAARSGDRFAAHAILYRPEGPSKEWDRAEAATIDEATIPGLQRWSDPGGRLSKRFGVETSGHILLYDPAGRLLFGGGITPSRGHRGENLGLEALAARVEGMGDGTGRSPIFGCPLLGPESRAGKEVGR
jgi:hypothetical protein